MNDDEPKVINPVHRADITGPTETDIPLFVPVIEPKNKGMSILRGRRTLLKSIGAGLILGTGLIALGEWMKRDKSNGNLEPIKTSSDKNNQPDLKDTPETTQKPPITPDKREVTEQDKKDVKDICLKYIKPENNPSFYNRLDQLSDRDDATNKIIINNYSEKLRLTTIIFASGNPNIPNQEISIGTFDNSEKNIREEIIVGRINQIANIAEPSPNVPLVRGSTPEDYNLLYKIMLRAFIIPEGSKFSRGAYTSSTGERMIGIKIVFYNADDTTTSIAVTSDGKFEITKEPSKEDDPNLHIRKI